MILMSVSLSSRWVAKLWRSACSVTPFLIPAASAASWNRRLSWRGGIRLPGLGAGKNPRFSLGVSGLLRGGGALPPLGDRKRGPAEQKRKAAGKGRRVEL